MTNFIFYNTLEFKQTYNNTAELRLTSNTYNSPKFEHIMGSEYKTINKRFEQPELTLFSCNHSHDAQLATIAKLKSMNKRTSHILPYKTVQFIVDVILNGDKTQVDFNGYTNSKVPRYEDLVDFFLGKTEEFVFDNDNSLFNTVHVKLLNNSTILGTPKSVRLRYVKEPNTSNTWHDSMTSNICKVYEALSYNYSGPNHGKYNVKSKIPAGQYQDKFESVLSNMFNKISIEYIFDDTAKEKLDKKLNSFINTKAKVEINKRKDTIKAKTNIELKFISILTKYNIQPTMVNISNGIVMKYDANINGEKVTNVIKLVYYADYKDVNMLYMRIGVFECTIQNVNRNKKLQVADPDIFKFELAMLDTIIGAYNVQSV